MTDPEFHLAPAMRIRPFETGAREPCFLVEAEEGRRWQVNAATAQLLEALAAAPSLAVAAERLRAVWGREVDPVALAEHLDRTLVPLGMLTRAGAAQAPSERRVGGALGFLSYRRTLVPARHLRALSGALSVLFHPVLFWPALAVAVGVAGWVLFGAVSEGATLLSMMLAPGAVLGVLASLFVHELGHAAACRRFGTRHGDLGFGLYLVFPVLYMEVDEAWALSRARRAVVDAGGLYLQILFGLAFLAVAQRFPALGPAALGTMALIGVGLVTNLNPFFRFDGYWLLSDLLGVPNLRRKSWLVLRNLRQYLRPGGGAGNEILPGGISRATAAGLAAYAALAGGFFVFYFGRLLVVLPEYASREYPRLVSLRAAEIAAALHSGAPLRALSAAVSLLPPTALLVGLVLLLLLRLRAAAAWARRRAVSAPSATPLAP